MHFYDTTSIVTTLENLRGYVLVVGLGRSGYAVARFLKEKGCDVVATDRDSSRADVAEKLEALGIKTEIGFHGKETFNRADLIITSPGIPLDMPFLKGARSRGVEVTGELDIFSGFNRKPVTAVTGTNGKTTTVTLISEMIKASHMGVFTGGNIGIPLVDNLENQDGTDTVVAEVSSFQMDTSGGFRPETGVLLNITPDHLDRYSGFSAYEESKWRLFRNQRTGDTAVIHAGISGLEKRLKEIESRPLLFGSNALPKGYPGAVISETSIRMEDEDGRSGIENLDGLVFDLSHTHLPGRHNRENLAAAALAALASGASPRGIQSVMDTFPGLPHRVAHVGRVNGVDYYNDSKGTNIDAVIRALECFNRGVVLILGGREKDTDFTQLIPAVTARVSAVVALGEARENIQKNLGEWCRVFSVSSMESAVNRAASFALEGETVLLSPACASFDMYANYEERGEDFIHWVQSIGEDRS